MKITLISLGRLKAGPLLTLCQDYEKRFSWSLHVEEIPFNRLSQEALLKREGSLLLKNKAEKVGGLKILLDERGQQLTSTQFATKVRAWGLGGQSHLTFLIGGAEGLEPELIDPHAFCLSLGRPTWPHLMVRLLLLEQLYRAQQIIAGHPYHK